MKAISHRIGFKWALPPLSIYIHTPWCIRKCPYCDFNSHETTEIELPEEQYLKALEEDLIYNLPHIWGRSIISVFIGGGTPSILSTKTIDRILQILRNLLNISSEIEITLEANPATFESEKFAAYRSSGINRLSIGIQSFNNKNLQALGRVHDSQSAINACEIAKKFFDNFNLDIMYALPDQSLKECEEDIILALQLESKHLSLYQLTLEPNTLFSKFPPKILPSEDEIIDMEEMIHELTALRGFKRYEISAYALDGWQCIHNRNYWEFGDYVGIGPGAHSKISFPDKIIREVREKHPIKWIKKCMSDQKGAQIIEHRELKVEELPFEFMLNALRLKDGVPTNYFEERCGVSMAVALPNIKRAVDKGLLSQNPLEFKATDLGWKYLNNLQEIFLI
ncbi:radical SAM family heme chaperone HemW [Taylorella equigenitalis]|uniref:radical SAM family heme chaperone HemW n=1 Tax=Taylorella equigenitalis TaxID=29575 RepID=UPI00041CB5E5|nr:radical SAM family heme chaperone HemW [Taylorella equigenitalis]WDU47446.1 radical SAM family heme chaperone HemW [Taylorella equigenitalis]